jgi:DNA-binding CsgD family transcriptional regulator
LTIGIAQNRWDRDFTERDRFLLDTVRPHLRQAYENACIVTDLMDKARQLAHAFERIDRGIVVIDEKCRVRQASAAAVRFVGEYLPDQSLTSTTLPSSLEKWAAKQIAALCRREDQASQHPFPHIVEGASGRLVLRVIADTQPNRFLVVMHNAARLESSQPLRGLDLTDREADVLYWCIEGKSRAEIGAILRISERTVQKHLEHVYAKLQVPNRVAAVTKALEWLRL